MDEWAFIKRYVLEWGVLSNNSAYLWIFEESIWFSIDILSKEKFMTITLNHTIVPCFNNVESAKLYCKLFGFEYVGEFSRFIVVRVNDTLCLDFDSRDQFESNHYAFKVSEQEFDEIFERLQTESIK